MIMNKQPTPDEIIDALGGTSKVAKMRGITDSAVTQWRGNGIPPLQMELLRLAQPEVFARLKKIPAMESAPP